MMSFGFVFIHLIKNTSLIHIHTNMDTTISPMYKLLSIHEHPLLPSAMFIVGKCDGCRVRGLMYGSYYCNKANCFCWFHKDCAESPLEINHHPSHPEHPLLLTKMAPAEEGNR